MFQIDEEKSSDKADRTSELRNSTHYYNHLSPRNGPLNWKFGKWKFTSICTIIIYINWNGFLSILCKY